MLDRDHRRSHGFDGGRNRVRALTPHAQSHSERAHLHRRPRARKHCAEGLVHVLRVDRIPGKQSREERGKVGHVNFTRFSMSLGYVNSPAGVGRDPRTARFWISDIGAWACSRVDT